MPKISGNRLPKTMRDRGIRWIHPGVVKVNFEHEQRLREEGYRAGFAAGFAAAKAEEKGLPDLAVYKQTNWDRHCKRAGFTPDEFNALSHEV